MSNIHTPTDQVLSKCLDLGTLATQNSLGVDCLSYSRAKMLIAATTAAASTLDAVVQESNDNGVTDPYLTVLGSNITTIPASSNKATRTLSVNLSHRKRFLRVAETVAGTVNGFVGIELYNAEEMPVTQDFAPVSF